MKIYLITISIVLSVSYAQAQRVYFEKPTKLPAVVNSPAEEVFPIMHGAKMYFVRAFGDRNTGGKNTGHDIWKAYRTPSGDWALVNNYLEDMNTVGSNAVVGTSGDGQRLYLLNVYNGKEMSEAGISVSKRTFQGWSKPTPIALNLAPASRIYGAYMHPDEDVLLVSMQTQSTKGKEDLFLFSKATGTWSDPIHLSGISSSGFDISPFLSTDKRTLYFASNRSGGLGGSDIYSSTRKGSGWADWSEPVNLGDRINSSSFDAYFSMMPDSTVYFASNRSGIMSDIYESELVFEPAPKEIVVEKKDTEVESSIYDFNIINYVYFDFDKYSLKPRMRNFLQDVADKMQASSLYKVRLEGHTDYIGSKDYNKALGKKRAKTVKKFLMRQGIPKTKIKTISFGESKPMLDARMNGKDIPSARALNRRVRIEIFTD